jgi:hypothetical protein
LSENSKITWNVQRVIIFIPISVRVHAFLKCPHSIWVCLKVGYPMVIPMDYKVIIVIPIDMGRGEWYPHFQKDPGIILT